jgi:hypothetical protein
MSTFYSGLNVRYRDKVGVVNFVCEKYITVCIKTYEHKSRDVCLLVYQPQWKQVQLLKESEK